MFSGIQPITLFVWNDLFHFQSSFVEDRCLNLESMTVAYLQYRHFQCLRPSDLKCSLTPLLRDLSLSLISFVFCIDGSLLCHANIHLRYFYRFSEIVYGFSFQAFL